MFRKKHPSGRHGTAQGGTVSYTHPAMESLDLYKSAYSAKGLPVDAALGRVDTVDVMGSGYQQSVVLWYHLLNCGFRLPAAAGTDVFLNRIVSSPPGWGRAYVSLNERSLLKWIERLEADLRKRDRLPGPALDHALQQIEAARTVYRKLIP